ncbi:DNA polymerase [Rivihabitans pingtungensis]|uniref:Type-4 uracil-DNA glycosylase n=2 Tax=Rivihabitans pingtungensis TaxID=1054498 RepID=A0A318LI55_9NEIS|nr:DNA polymerase [Rivihabitans pingtungensis]
MTDRHSQILEALGLGPRWLPRHALPGAAPVAAEEAEPPLLPLAECTAPPVPVAQASVEPLDEGGVLAANPPAEAPAAPAAHAQTQTQAEAPAAVMETLVLAQAPALTPAEPEAAGIESASAPMAEASLFADSPNPAAAPDAPSPAAVALPADWDNLRAEVAACQRCRLCETRTQTVFARGNPQARWLFVGEAPGEQEDLQGLPFVGPAGKLLDNMLAALGLDREQDVYIANVLKCRPPRNRNPQGDEILACQPYLRQQIAWQQPAVIVALGRFAAQTLLDTEASIGSLRSKVHEYAGVPLVVSYHPAYLLRTLPDKAKAWQDLLFAREVMRRQG